MSSTQTTPAEEDCCAQKWRQDEQEAACGVESRRRLAQCPCRSRQAGDLGHHYDHGPDRPWHCNRSDDPARGIVSAPQLSHQGGEDDPEADNDHHRVGSKERSRQRMARLLLGCLPPKAVCPRPTAGGQYDGRAEQQRNRHRTEEERSQGTPAHLYLDQRQGAGHQGRGQPDQARRRADCTHAKTGLAREGKHRAQLDERAAPTIGPSPAHEQASDEEQGNDKGDERTVIAVDVRRSLQGDVGPTGTKRQQADHQERPADPERSHAGTGWLSRPQVTTTSVPAPGGLTTATSPWICLTLSTIERGGELTPPHPSSLTRRVTTSCPTTSSMRRCEALECFSALATASDASIHKAFANRSSGPRSPATSSSVRTALVAAKVRRAPTSPARRGTGTPLSNSASTSCRARVDLAGQLLANSFAVSRAGAQPGGQRKSHQSLLSAIVKVALQALASVVGPVDQL